LAYSNAGGCLQSVLGRAGQNQLFTVQLKLGNRNSDVVLRDRKETAGIDDGVGDRLVGRDNDVLDRANAFIRVVVDRMSQDLPLGAPAKRHITQLGVAGAKQGRPGDLGL
jgi:hypothetical protein